MREVAVIILVIALFTGQIFEPSLVNLAMLGIVLLLYSILLEIEKVNKK